MYATFREVSSPDGIFAPTELLSTTLCIHLKVPFYFNNRNSFGLFSDRIFVTESERLLFYSLFFSIYCSTLWIILVGGVWFLPPLLLSSKTDATFHSNWIRQICWWYAQWSQMFDFWAWSSALNMKKIWLHCLKNFSEPFIWSPKIKRLIIFSIMPTE